MRGISPVAAIASSAVCSAALVAGVYLGWLPAVAGLVAVALVTVTIFWQIRTHLPSILAVFTVVLLAGTAASGGVPKLRPDRADDAQVAELARAWSTGGRFDGRLPIVVHVIFDEMVSVGALTDDLPGAAEARDILSRVAGKHRLRLFDSVYSRYFFSNDSLPNLMGPEYQGRTGLADVAANPMNRFPENAYFEDMEARGYRTVVFQSAVLDFCANAAVDRCETFPSFDPTPGGLDVRNRTAVLWRTLLRSFEPSFLSAAGDTLHRRFYGIGTRELGIVGAYDRYDVQAFPQWFDRFAAFAPTVPRGTHLFAHFMVPHAPYLLTRDCVVSGAVTTGYYLAGRPPEERAEKRRTEYESYLAQLVCAARKLDELLTAIDDAPQFEDAIVVVHGDHGSRISAGEMLEDLTPRDFIDNFATFFAVRAPGVEPGVDCEFLSLPQAFRRYLAPGATHALAAGGRPLPVHVRSRAGLEMMIDAEMPPFGCGAGSGTADGGQ